uniref:Uncharacterized protein n=1 Tax=Corethron hystrix TaxID=216773 RepID=A0A7S1FQ32_9STRA
MMRPGMYRAACHRAAEEQILDGSLRLGAMVRRGSQRAKPHGKVFQGCLHALRPGTFHRRRHSRVRERISPAVLRGGAVVPAHCPDTGESHGADDGPGIHQKGFRGSHADEAPGTRPGTRDD